MSRRKCKISKTIKRRFKRPFYWNKYKVIDSKVVEIAAANAKKHIREFLDSSYQGVKRLFGLANDNTAGNDQVSNDSFKKYFFPRVKIGNYNIEIDGRNFYDQPINDSIKQYEEFRKVSTGQGYDYTTGSLLDYAYFKDNFRIIAADLRKQKVLDADSRAIQQIIFTDQVEEEASVFYVLEKSKETILQFSKGTKKVLQVHING